jgi:hypothetical protein
VQHQAFLLAEMTRTKTRIMSVAKYIPLFVPTECDKTIIRLLLNKQDRAIEANVRDYVVEEVSDDDVAETLTHAQPYVEDLSDEEDSARKQPVLDGLVPVEGRPNVYTRALMLPSLTQCMYYQYVFTRTGDLLSLRNTLTM